MSEEKKGFDSEKFMATDFKDRIADVHVPALKKFFPKDEKPVWTVKCLTAEEIAIANDAVAENKNINEMITAIAANNKSEKIDAIKGLMGIHSDKVPDEVVRRISLMVHGSVNPVCSQEMAVKIGVNHGTTFYKITNKILELTGMGRLGE